MVSPNVSVCVFCGSRLGHQPGWASLAAEVGMGIASRHWRMVFGAGRWGLMGTTAQAALEGGAEVIGIIPRYLTETEPVLPGLTRVEVVETMIERKVRMLEESDAFLILPGGLGTLEELFEVWTAVQTGAHRKPIVVANIEGYYDGLMAYLKQVADHGFLAAGHLDQVQLASSVDEVFRALEAGLSSRTEA